MATAGAQGARAQTSSSLEDEAAAAREAKAAPAEPSTPVITAPAIPGPVATPEIPVKPNPNAPPAPQNVILPPNGAPPPESNAEGKLHSDAIRTLSDEEINQKIFKKSQKSEPSTVFLPVYYERMERALGRVKAHITEIPGGAKVEVEGIPMIKFLNDLVLETWTKRLDEITEQCTKKISPPNNECFIALAPLSADGVQVDFSYQALEIRVHVAPELRTPKMSTIFNLDGSTAENITDSPGFITSYVNMNMNQTIRSNDIVYKNGREPILGQFDSGTRIGSVIIEASGRYNEQRTEIPNTQSEFIRDDVRALMDFPAQSLRAEVGDLIYPVQGFQNYSPMAGASVFTQFTLQPSRLTLPSGTYEVFLARPSQVIVFVNEQLVQILELPSGRHYLRDFPFNSGVNDLKLEIHDDVGRVETLDYSYFSSNFLLKPGLQSMSYSVGAPWTEGADGVRVYNSSLTTYSAFHRLGFSERFTAGLNTQGNSQQSMTGAEALLSTHLGYFGFEPAVSMTQGRSSGYAGHLRYAYQDYVGKQRSSRTISAEAIAMSADFTQLGTPQQINPGALKILANFARAVSKSTTASGSMDYQFSRNTASNNSDTYGLSLSLTERWNSGITTTGTVRHEKIVSGSEDISVMGFIIYAMPKDRQVVSATVNSQSSQARGDWSYQPSPGVGGTSAQAHIENNNIDNGYGGRLDYTGNRVRLDADEDVEISKQVSTPPQPSDKQSVKTTNLRVGTALVFAGGHVAVSRPVTDSFVMFAPLDNLKGQNVQINPQIDGSYIAETDFLGPAVVPEVSSYNYTGYLLGQKTLKTGTSLPRDHFLLLPPYHGGYAIEIGTDALVYLKMVLKDEKGQPAAMIAAQAIYLDDPKKDQVTVFTNRSGLIRSEGFRSGRYRMEFHEDAFEPIEFTIPKSAGDDVDLGTIQVKAVKK